MVRILFICLLSLCASAQQSQFIYGSQLRLASASSGIFDATAYPGLFLWLQSDRATSITNIVDNTAVSNWFDLWTNHFDMTNYVNANGQPIFHTTTGPSSGPAISFKDQSATPYLLSSKKGNLGATQPITWYTVCKVQNTANGFANDLQTQFDSISGNRELFQTSPDGNPVFFAGTVTHPPQYSDPVWVVFAIQFNGASSLIETNNVTYSSGLNPGASGMDWMIIGTDQTKASQWFATVTCILGYTNLHNATTRGQVVSALRSHFAF